MWFWIERSAPATNWEWLYQNEEKVLVFCFEVTFAIFVIYNLALRTSILTHKSHMHANNTCQGSGSGNIHSGFLTQPKQSFKVSHSSNQSPPIYFISPYFAAFRHSFASLLEPQNTYPTSFCVLWTFTSTFKYDHKSKPSHYQSKRFRHSKYFFPPMCGRFIYTRFCIGNSLSWNAACV